MKPGEHHAINEKGGGDVRRDAVGDIVSLAAVAWDFPLVGRTRMLTEAWSRAGRATVFVEAPHSWRAALRHALRGGHRQAGGDGPAAQTADLKVIRPRPTWPARFWHMVGQRRVRASLRRRAGALRQRLDGLIDWRRSTAVVVTPAWLPWLDALPFGRVIYDCIDDLSVHAPAAGLRCIVAEWERELIARADAAVVTARSLADGVRSHRPTLPIETIRNAADVAMFASRAAAAPRPADLPTGRPILGFVGALYEWIDFDLIEQTARRLADWQLVLVGPANRSTPVGRLRALANVQWLGPRPHADVPAYVAAFDACWAPFRPMAVSAAANPVKIYEYLSLGKPVLTTAVADTDSFEGLVRVVAGPEDVARALSEARDEPAGAAAARRRFAAANDWDARAGQYGRFIARLG